MEQGYSHNRIQQGQRKRKLSLSNVAFFVLCGYLAMTSLAYVDWIPTDLVSISLYGFVAISAVILLLRGSVRIGEHVIWLLVFTALCGISILYSQDRSGSIAEVMEMAKVLLFAMMFLNIVDSRKKMLTAMGVVAVAPLGLFVHLAVTGQLEVTERLGQTLTGNANTFATLYMVGAMCMVYFICFAPKLGYRLLALAGLLIHMYALALSGGRKFFVLPVVLFAGVKLLNKDKKGRHQIVQNLLLAVLLLGGTWWAIFNVDVLYESIGYRMEGLINAIVGTGEVDASTLLRSEMVDSAMELWKQSPLWGNGIDSFKSISTFRVYAHNNYAELLCDLGMIGLAGYYWFFVSLFRKLAKALDLGRDRWYWIWIVICVLLFDFGAVSYDMFSIHMMLLFASAALRYPEEIVKTSPEGKMGDNGQL